MIRRLWEAEEDWGAELRASRRWVCGLPDIGSRRFRVVRTRQPIPLPQRLRLLRAAKCVERIGGEHSSSAFCVSYFILRREFQVS